MTNANLNQPVTPSQEATAQRRGRLKNQLSVLVVLLVIGVVGVELWAKMTYDASVGALNAALGKQGSIRPPEEMLKQADLADCIYGWPRQTKMYQSETPALVYRWPSLFMDCVAILTINESGVVTHMHTGRDNAAKLTSRPAAGNASALAMRKPGWESARAPVVMLVWHRGPMMNNARPQLLTEQLIHQSFLIAARDELGYTTRDEALGHPIPTARNPVSKPFNLKISAPEGGQLQVELCVGELRDKTVVTSFVMASTNESPLEEIVAETEALSQNTFKVALQDFGFDRQPPGGRASDDDVPAESKFAVGDIDYLSQFSRLRRLHQNLHETGETPQIIGALARSYAVLGTLTEYYWGQLPIVCKARALLYAERLMHGRDDRAFAMYNRAFVRALVGMHSSALQDLAEAKTVEDAAADRSEAEWAAVIESFCNDDGPALDKLALNAQHSHLATYLNLLRADLTSPDRQKVEAANSMLELIPGQMRSLSVVTRAAELEQKLLDTPAVFELATAEFCRYLREDETIPDSVRQQVPVLGGALPAQVEVRRKLIDALRSADDSMPSYAEPPLSFLATSFHELSFYQAWQQIRLKRIWQYEDNDELIEQLRPLFSDHEFASTLSSYQWDWSTVPESVTDMLNASRWRRTYATAGVFDLVYDTYDRNNYYRNQLNNIMLANASYVFGDLVKAYQTEHRPEIQSSILEYLRKISPNSSMVLADEIAHDWPRFESQASELEQYHNKNVAILAALADQYVQSWAYGDAERCLRRCLELAPSYSLYSQLAAVYDAMGDQERWLETMEASYELSESPITFQRSKNAHTRMQIANHFMDRGEFELAQPYADAAANSGTGWGLLCAARCYEGLGDWASAAKMQQATAQYYGTVFEWYRWCRRNGTGDVEAAKTSLQPIIAKWRQATDGESYLSLGAYTYLEGDTEQSLDAFRKSFEEAEDSTGVYGVVNAAVLADEMGRENERDELLNIAMKRCHTDSATTVPADLVWQIMRIVASGRPSLHDLKLIDWLIHYESEPGSRTNHSYLIGKVLLQRGAKDDALAYLRRAATSSYYNKFNHTMAGFTLRKLGEEPTALRGTELDETVARLAELTTTGDSFRDSQQYQRALLRYNKALELDPSFTPAVLSRAALYETQGDQELALADFNNAVRQDPDLAVPYLFRGRFFERIGWDGEALQDYNTALQLDADSPAAHNGIAWIQAASADESLRNGELAMMHAQAVPEISPVAPWMRLGALAAAHAELNQFEQAVERAKQSQELAPVEQHEQLRAQLQQYERQQPFRRPSRDQ